MTTVRYASRAVVLLLAFAAPAEAQIADTSVTTVDSIIIEPQVPVTTLPADSAPLPLEPRDAFIRSMIVPGWGQAAFGAYFRGGIYFAGWAGNAFQLVKTMGRLDDARDRLGRRRVHIVNSLIAGSEEPDSMRRALEEPGAVEQAVRADSLGNDLRKLVRAREQQREDWIAFSLFWLLASGVDAYVTAHLADFPTEIDLEPQADGSVSVGFRVPLPVGRGRPDSPARPSVPPR